MTYIVISKSGRYICKRRNRANAAKVARSVRGKVYTPEALRLVQVFGAVAEAASGAARAFVVMGQAVSNLQKAVGVANAGIDTAVGVTRILRWGEP